MRVFRSMAIIIGSLAVTLLLTSCDNREQAESMAAGDVPRVREAIESVNDNGLRFTVTSETACEEGCTGVLVIHQTSGVLTVSDVEKLHEAVVDIQLARNPLWGNHVVLRPLAEYHDVGFEAGYCVHLGGDFHIEDDPNPQCIPRPSSSPSS